MPNSITVLCIGPARPETPIIGQVGAVGRVAHHSAIEAVFSDAHDVGFDSIEFHG